MTHGQMEEAERIVADIEAKAGTPHNDDVEKQQKVKLRTREQTPFSEIWKAIAVDQPKRSVLAFVLMVSQAFFYNSLLFTYGLVLLKFYRVPAERVGLYLLSLAVGNILGPLLLGKLFDSVGRKLMIATTYSGAGVLLWVSAWMFQHNMFTAQTQSLAWAIVLFVASSAASSAYLTVSEVFPLEIRALAIAIFYACGTLIGGVGAPALFARLIASGSKTYLFWGYTVSAVLMIAAGLTEAFIGVSAEGQSLEAVSAPLSSKAS
jgi:MFS family permease